MGRRTTAGYSFNLLVIFFAFFFTFSVSTGDFLRCESLVKNWATSSLNGDFEGDKHTLQSLLFFLHVPRTGGRTYFNCFLRKLYTSDHECPRSYDKLHFDPGNPNCRLMVTHDDYSIMSKLPKESTSVVTILRSPVDRVFSTYEFSVEVAARFLIHPNLSSATRMFSRLRPKTKSIGVSTLDIWPWKYLVPWMREDLFGRRDARGLGKFTEIKDGSNPYNMKEMVMPLHVFIDDPIAHDIIHNGATYQVAGLTNNSYLAESHDIRHCIRKHPELGQYVLGVAKKRLDDMLYVGLTEDHKESATMFANMVGVQVLSLLENLSPHTELAENNDSMLASQFSVTDSDFNSNQLKKNELHSEIKEIRSNNNVRTAVKSDTVAKLMGAYNVCISGLRKTQAIRRVTSLKHISPVNFSVEARLLVPHKVIEKILSLNSLDVELYKHAQSIFAQQHRHIVDKFKMEMHEQTQRNSLGFSPENLIILVVTVSALFLLWLCVISRKRTIKLKK